MPDDASLGAEVAPIIDTLVGLSLIFGGRGPRLVASGLRLMLFVVGLAMQIHAGKDYLGDLALVTLVVASTIVSCK